MWLNLKILIFIYTHCFNQYKVKTPTDRVVQMFLRQAQRCYLFVLVNQMKVHSSSSISREPTLSSTTPRAGSDHQERVLMARLQCRPCMSQQTRTSPTCSSSTGAGSAPPCPGHSWEWRGTRHWGELPPSDERSRVEQPGSRDTPQLSRSSSRLMDS